MAAPVTASIAEPSTWAMMTLGFAGLAFAGYRRSRRGQRNAPRFIQPLQNAPVSGGVFSFPPAVS